MNRPLLLLLSVLATSVSAAADNDDSDDAVPLFEDNRVLDVSITAPFDDIMRTRSLEEEVPGVFVYVDPDTGDDVSLDIEVRARGKFRRQKEICSFAPLRLDFRKSNQTLFANSDKLKLVTHCRNGSGTYEQSVYKEYLAYRILNVLTDFSFRVRLLNVRYIEASNGEELMTSPAFLLESEKQLARRFGMERDESEKTTIGNLDPAHTNLVSVFQYLIGNTDFSPIMGPPGEECCHNYVLLTRDDGRQVSVPYDFDVTGLADPPHAKPNPRFGLANVKQRLYRGRCANNEHLEKSFIVFQARKPAIYELVETQPGLTKRERRSVKRYIDKFYRIIESDWQVNYRFLDACLGEE